MIGMDYTASQAVWDEALALGKPVIGHIAPSQSAYNTAMSKGASGVQVSGVGVVTPVSWWT
jgi:lysyl-tRNA synthetase class I